MRLGKLDTVITLQRPIQQNVLVGQAVVEYQDADTVHANVRQLKDFEVVRFRQINRRSDVEFTIRAREDIDAAWQIVHDCTYRVENIRLSEDKRFMTISAYKQV
jgi:SPP1 family predicted phage head-tail adaptor